jgi:hypothetical protein
MNFTLTEYVIWALTVAAHCGVLAVIYREKLQRSFRYFTLYIACEIARSALIFAALKVGYRQYFWCYWISKAVIYVFQVGLLCEIFKHVFTPYGLVTGVTKRRVAILVACVSLFAIFLWIHFPPAIANRYIAIIIGIDRTCCIIQFGTFVVLAAYAEVLGLTWRHHAFGVAIGFGMFTGMDLLATTINLEFGWLSYLAVKYIRVTVYLLAVLFWMIALSQEEPERIPVTEDWMIRIRTAGEPLASFLHTRSKEPE